MVKTKYSCLWIFVFLEGSFSYGNFDGKYNVSFHTKIITDLFSFLTQNTIHQLGGVLKTNFQTYISHSRPLIPDGIHLIFNKVWEEG